MTPKRLWTRLATLVALTTILAACGAVVAPVDPEPAANPEPAAPQASCEDVAISVLERGAGVHGAIVSDMLHMGGATAPATCMDPANQSLLAGLSVPDGRTEQAQQSQYYLIVIRYPGGNRLYVLSRRADGSSCVVDTNDQCIARVTDLPDDFDLDELPDDVAPTIPAGRPAPPTVNPPPGDETPPAPGDDTPPAPGPAPGDETPPAPSPPPGDGAPPGAAARPQPRDGATGVSRFPPLSWLAARGALSYDLYIGTTEDLTAETALEGTAWPLDTQNTFYNVPSFLGLQFETLYYWRVDAKTEAGTIRGNVWSFTTLNAPGLASNPQPRDGATGVTVAGPLLSWAAAPHATNYQVYWGTTIDRPTEFKPIQTSSTFLRIATSEDLEPETLYYWRVNATNEGGGISGKTWSFTTAPAPAPTEPTAPAEPTAPTEPTAPAPAAAAPKAAWYPDPSSGATNVIVAHDGTLYVIWEYGEAGGRGGAATTSFDVYWGTTENLAADADLGTPVRRTHNSIVLEPLASGTTYYWRVDANNAAGTTRGHVWSFTTRR